MMHAIIRLKVKNLFLFFFTFSLDEKPVLLHSLFTAQVAAITKTKKTL